MFDIGWGELLVIGIVALVVIGPKELPGVLRMLGQGMTKIRRMASEFQGQFQEAMREAEMHDIKKQVDDAARGLTSYDPLHLDTPKPAPSDPLPPPETQPSPEPGPGTVEAPKETMKPGEGRPS